MEFKYKKQVSLEERKKIAKHIIQKERVPLVCENDPKSNLSIGDKTHFLVPYEMTVAQFSLILRKRVKIDKTCSLFLSANGEHSITGNQLMFEVYNKYKDPEDGILYIAFATELIWG